MLTRGAEPLLCMQVNSDPFTSGWMLKVKLTDPSQVDSLMDAKAYEKHCEDNAH